MPLAHLIKLKIIPWNTQWIIRFLNYLMYIFWWFKWVPKLRPLIMSSYLYLLRSFYLQSPSLGNSLTTTSPFFHAMTYHRNWVGCLKQFSTCGFLFLYEVIDLISTHLYFLWMDIISRDFIRFRFRFLQQEYFIGSYCMYQVYTMSDCSTFSITKIQLWDSRFLINNYFLLK